MHKIYKLALILLGLALSFHLAINSRSVEAQTTSVNINPGDNIQALVNANPENTTFIIKSGLHRLQSVSPKNGNIFHGENGAILNGSTLVSTWVKQGAYWVASNQTQPEINGGECESDYPRCGHTADLFINNLPLKHVGSLANVGAGSYYFEYSTDKVYLGDDPTGKTVEIATSPFAFKSNASNVKIKNLSIEKYAVPVQNAAVQSDLGNGWVVEYTSIQWNHGVGFIGGSGSIIRNSKLNNNGMHGIGGTGTNLLVENNEIAYNNYAHIMYGWSAGGSKWAYTTNLTVKGNYVHDNRGPGLWTDIDNTNTIYDGNLIVNNQFSGIFHEISYSCVIKNNTSMLNGRDDDWVMGAQIQISNSSNCDIYGNKLVVSDTYGHALSLTSQERPPYKTRNNTVHNNNIIFLGTRGEMAVAGDDDGTLYTTNTFNTDTFLVKNTSHYYFGWMNAARNWNDFRNNFGQELNGTISAALTGNEASIPAWNVLTGPSTAQNPGGTTPPPAPPPDNATLCKADYNKTGTVDIFDFATFAQNYKRQGINCAMDIIGDDCYLSVGDFSAFASIYKKSNACTVDTPVASGEYERWSSTSTWGGAVPSASTIVNIPSGKKVLFDAGTTTVDGIIVDHDAELVFEDKDFNLTTRYIVVHGKMQIGTETAQFQSKGKITLTGTDKAENIMPNMGTKGILVHSGVLDIHGKLSNTSWARINQHANKGATSIVMEKSVDWKSGDIIVIASTDFDLNQAEKLTVTSVSGNQVNFTPALKYNHFGQKQIYDGKTLENRAEVGLLSRNILIQGQEPDLNNGFGGHVMAGPESIMKVEGVELTNMGQSGILARYPLHWHLADIAPPGNYVRNNSIHNTFNRCITVHGTRGVTVENNVCYETEGHSFFVEDASEENNTFTSNLGINARRAKRAIIESDDEHVFSPAVFWIGNPNNNFYNNVSAGSEGVGFWFDVPRLTTGPSRIALPQYNSLEPFKRPLGVFVGNLSHSNDEMGLFFDQYAPLSHGTVKDMTVYKSRDFGIWNESNGFIFNGSYLTYDNAIVADSRTAIQSADYAVIKNSTFIGDSANLGNPDPGDTTGPDGRTLPFPHYPSAEYLGMRFYTGKTISTDNTFVNWVSNSIRPAGAYGWRQDLIVGTEVVNALQRTKLINSNGFYVHGDTLGKSLHIKDIDGSITGFANSYLVSEYPLAHDINSVYKPEWKGYAQKTPVVQVRTPCDSGCNHIILRDDGVMTSKTYSVDGRHNAVAGRTYYFYRQDTNCNFSIDMNHESTAHWLMYGIHYTCQLSRIELGGNGSGNLTAANSIAEVQNSTGNRYFYDQSKSKLYIKIQGITNASYTDGMLRDPGRIAYKVYGSGSNQVMSPINDPNRPVNIN